MVVGIGNIGLLAVLVARAKGAGNIIAVGKYAARQALARAYGATLVLEPDDPRLLEQIRQRTSGVGAALVLEAAEPLAAFVPRWRARARAARSSC